MTTTVQELNAHYKYLLGRRIKQARNMTLETVILHIARRDGVDMPPPMDTDYKEYRLNVELRNTYIVNILSIG